MIVYVKRDDLHVMLSCVQKTDSYLACFCVVMYVIDSSLSFSLTNRPFPSSKKFHFQNEAKCETFVVKMSFICIIIKNHFHVNGFALSLALKVRFFGTRKWPITLEYWTRTLSRNTTKDSEFSIMSEKGRKG